MAWMVAPPLLAGRVPGETFGHDALEPLPGGPHRRAIGVSLARPDMH